MTQIRTRQGSKRCPVAEEYPCCLNLKWPHGFCPFEPEKHGRQPCLSKLLGPMTAAVISGRSTSLQGTTWMLGCALLKAAMAFWVTGVLSKSTHSTRFI